LWSPELHGLITKELIGGEKFGAAPIENESQEKFWTTSSLPKTNLPIPDESQRISDNPRKLSPMNLWRS